MSRPLITEREVRAAMERGESVIRTSGDAIITPLAASTLAEHGIRVQPDGTGPRAGDTGPGRVASHTTSPRDYDPGFLLGLYATMQRIRGFETAVGLLFRQGRIVGFAHLSVGQEAVPTGICAALDKNDYLTLTHRGHGQMVARGARLDLMMAELYGKGTGYCKGKGGSVHLHDFQLGILGANGIIGANLVITAGAAMSAKMRGTQQVAVAFFGDGVVNQGAFHEALNIASVRRLPILFVCENNQYAVSMSEREATAAESIAARGAAYLMPAVRVDGQDVLAVYEAAKQAVARARRGDGPTMIECVTYRARGHWEGETVELRPEGERKEWADRDPILRLSKELIEARVATREQLAQLADTVREEVVQATRFAEESPYPPLAEAVQDVLSGEIVKR